MAGPDASIAAHYGGSGLFDRILGALEAHGIARDKVTMADLKAVDEFHIGGAAATEALLDPLDLAPGSAVLDLGSGIGGPARFMADRFGLRVTGIDLTRDFVETARRLTDLLGLDVAFVEGSALDLPFDDGAFDLATLLHVGMNLPDKPRLFSEVARVLRPGGTFAVYDVMLLGTHPAFPLPWAGTPDVSFLAPPEVYLDAADAAGLRLTHRRDRGEVARGFFADMQARMAAEGPPAAGLPLLMGEAAQDKVANMVAAVQAGDIAPVEMVFRKAG